MFSSCQTWGRGVIIEARMERNTKIQHVMYHSFYKEIHGRGIIKQKNDDMACRHDNSSDYERKETKAVIDERQKSPIEKRKRNLIFFSPISRRERET